MIFRLDVWLENEVLGLSEFEMDGGWILKVVRGCMEMGVGERGVSVKKVRKKKWFFMLLLNLLFYITFNNLLTDLS